MPPASSPRSPLEHSALQSAAGPDWSVRLLPETASTNAVAAADPRPGLVVVTDHQTAGRGRLDRSWETPAHSSLTLSAVVAPAIDAAHWPLLPLMTGMAVVRAVGPAARLKWPNDVMIEDRKVCGILLERVVGPDPRAPLAVIGIGINVDQATDELPVEHATSLALAGLDTDRTALLGRVLRGLQQGVGQLISSPSTVVADYRERCATLGRDVRVHLPDGSEVVGRADDVDEHGRLVVVPRDGPTTTDPVRGAVDGRGTLVVGAGDVVHIRSVE